jgi:hypothetical protein
MIMKHTMEVELHLEVMVTLPHHHTLPHSSLASPFDHPC